MTGAKRRLEPSEVILEFVRVGHVVKVTAVDPRTLTEVSIVAPAHVSPQALERTAVSKLAYVLRKADRLGS